VGFLSGVISMRLVDYILPRVHLFGAMSDAEGIKTSWRQTTLLALAITLHNIPKDWRLASRAGSRSRGAARLSDRVAAIWARDRTSPLRDPITPDAD